MTQNLLSSLPVGLGVDLIGPYGMVRTSLGNAASAGYVPSTPATWNPAPTTVGGALDSSALLRTQLIFRPTEPAPKGNVFATWATLAAAAVATPGVKTIFFDDSLAACSIPVGAYNFGDGCVFQGILPARNSASPNRVEITIPDGVTFTTPLFQVTDVRVTYSGVGALMTIPGDALNRVFWMTSNARLNPTGAGGRIFDVSAASIFNIVLTDLALVVAGGGLLATVLAGATQLAIRVIQHGSTAGNSIPANVLAGPVGPTYSFTADVLTLINVTQAAMPGGVIALGAFFFGSPLLPYTPAAPANWVAPAPTSVQNALDRIAAVVSLGGGTPIP